MFFIVHYGETDSLVLNSNCQCKILLERIKTRCNIQSDEIIDIADMQAVVQKLCDHPDEVSASKLIQPRGNYILVRVNRRFDENGQFCKEYTPLLNGLDSVNPDFITRLSSRKVNPDAYSKDGSGKDPGRLNLRRKNDSRASNRPKMSNMNLNAAQLRKGSQK